MKPKFYYASFIACFLVLNGFAQKQNVYFLKNDGRYVDLKDSADFIRIVREPDSGSVLYNVLDYYLNGNRKMVGKSSAIEPVKLEGMALSYFPDKKKKRVANYDKGKISGAVYDYYPNGKLYRAMEFQSNVQGTGSEPHFMAGENIQSVYDSSGVEIVKDGNGHYPIFDNDFKFVEEEGDVKDGKRSGLWKGTLNKGAVAFTEEYADGKFIKGTRTDESGNTKNYTVKEALPTFKGGESAFGNYLGQNIRYPFGAKDRNVQGRVILGFVVEKDGSIKDVKILKSVDPEIDAEAVRVISQSPKWNPGIQHGVPVKVSYITPINFTLGGR